MFVRVERTPKGLRVETCPISGTIKRGADALQDADRVFEILDSSKDKSELTMCTDVDRNDKSRVCKPGTVQVVGRRQIEKYSKLIHTVDHVEGYLRDGFDALDAFLVHTWAVTVSGVRFPLMSHDFTT
jgi:anthranilate synthase